MNQSAGVIYFSEDLTGVVEFAEEFSSVVVSPQEFAKALASRKAAKEGATRGSLEMLTDEQVRARIKFLEADNARMKAAITQRK